jgi:hypothetical protein
MEREEGGGGGVGEETRRRIEWKNEGKGKERRVKRGRERG